MNGFNFEILHSAFTTWHIVDASGLLKVLVVCHHLREQRPLHDAHHGWLLLVVGLKARRDKGNREQNKS